MWRAANHLLKFVSCWALAVASGDASQYDGEARDQTTLIQTQKPDNLAWLRARGIATNSIEPGAPVAVLDVVADGSCDAESVLKFALQKKSSCDREDLIMRSNTSFSIVVDAELGSKLDKLGCVKSVWASGAFRDSPQHVVGRSGVRIAGSKNSGYTRPDDLKRVFLQLATDYDDLAMLLDLTEIYNMPPTHEGHHMRALKITHNVSDDDSDKPRTLILPGHHARELMTPEMGLDLAQYLLREYRSGNQQVRSILAANVIYITYTWNPDGLYYVWESNNWWRKNRRPFDQEYGFKSHGVDLNRNYPFGWGQGCGGSDMPGSEVYQGPSAASESETRTMVAFQSDVGFAKVLDIHSYGREVRMNYANCVELPSGVQEVYRRVARALAGAMSYEPASSCCLGGEIAYAYHDHGALSLLVETGTDFHPPWREMRREVQRVRPGLLEFLRTPIPARGVIVDAENGERVEAALSLPDMPFRNGESKVARRGMYHLWLPSGMHRVTLSADGYETATVEVEAAVEGATPQTIHLRRDHAAK